MQCSVRWWNGWVWTDLCNQLSKLRTNWSVSFAKNKYWNTRTSRSMLFSAFCKKKLPIVSALMSDCVVKSDSLSVKNVSIQMKCDHFLRSCLFHDEACFNFYFIYNKPVQSIHFYKAINNLVPWNHYAYLRLCILPRWPR